MAILKIKNENGEWIEIPSIKGEKGDTPVKGTDYWTEEDKTEIKTYIDDIIGESIGGGGTNNIPSYWNEHLAEKIDAIKSLQNEGGKDCFSFIVLTDIHYPANLGKLSPIIARRLLDECDIKYALCLGDTQTRGCHNTKELLLAENEAIEKMLYPIRDRLLQTEGNHDGSYGVLDRDGDGISNTGKEPAERETYVHNLTPAEMHSAIYRKVGLVGDAHFDESGSGYYIDDTANKVRYIILNTYCNDYKSQDDGTQLYPKMWLPRFTQNQFNLVIEALNNIPSDSWGVVIGGHCPLTQEIGDREVMQGVLNAYRNKTTYSGTYDGTASGGLITSFTNKADVSDPDFLDGPYLNTNGEIGEGSNYFVTNYISAVCPNKNADIIYVHGFDTSSPLRVAVYKSDKTFILGTASSQYSDITIDENGIATWKVGYVNNYVSTANSNEIAYVRVSGKKKTTASEIVVTVNEEIAYTEGVSGYDAVSIDCDFSQAKGELVGYFAGHSHADGSTTVGNVTCITTRCDSAEENDSAVRAERVAGTTTEQSFDVFTVNKKKRKIYATKIGAGEDREISY